PGGGEQQNGYGQENRDPKPTAVIGHHCGMVVTCVPARGLGGGGGSGTVRVVMMISVIVIHGACLRRRDRGHAGGHVNGPVVPCRMEITRAPMSRGSAALW